MGDRSNVFIQQDFDKESEKWAGIGLYSHWHGEDLHVTAIAEIEAASARKGDPSYFARILTQRVLNALADPDSETGFGLWTTGPDDNEYPILVINANTGQHWYADESTYRDSQPA